MSEDNKIVASEAPTAWLVPDETLRKVLNVLSQLPYGQVEGIIREVQTTVQRAGKE